MRDDQAIVWRLPEEKGLALLESTTRCSLYDELTFDCLHFLNEMLLKAATFRSIQKPLSASLPLPPRPSAIHFGTSYSTSRSRILSSPPSVAMSSSKIAKVEDLQTSESKWVGLQAINWVDPTGRERKWESADRKTRKGEADAVAICCLITRPSTRNDPDLLLVSQFRPPVKVSGQETTSGLVIEMPAGLIDQGEEGPKGTEKAALRELAEETGYGNPENTKNGQESVQVVTISPVMYNDPGMTGSNMRLAAINIDLASDDSPDPVAKPDDGEFIEKRLVKFNGLWDELVRLQEEGKYAVDARLYHFAYGAKLAAHLNQGGNLAKQKI
ncbi:unnamed protein product [Sympodiomycopsis kandeliae]